eukprot:5122738-Pyramimonas_sp.AAC.1
MLVSQRLNSRDETRTPGAPLERIDKMETGSNHIKFRQFDSSHCRNRQRQCKTSGHFPACPSDVGRTLSDVNPHSKARMLCAQGLWLAAAELGAWGCMGTLAMSWGLENTTAVRASLLLGIINILVPLMSAVAGDTIGRMTWAASGAQTYFF